MCLVVAQQPKLSLPRCESSELALQPQKNKKVDKTKFKRPHTNSDKVRDVSANIQSTKSFL